MEEMVRFFHLRMDAEVAAGILKDAGINSLLQSMGVSTTGSNAGETRLFVMKEDAPRAREILDIFFEKDIFGPEERDPNRPIA